MLLETRVGLGIFHLALMRQSVSWKSDHKEETEWKMNAWKSNNNQWGDKKQ